MLGNKARARTGLYGRMQQESIYFRIITVHLAIASVVLIEGPWSLYKLYSWKASFEHFRWLMW